MRIKLMTLAVMGALAARTGLAMGALAVSINAEAHGKLADPIKALYVKQDDGMFKLDADFEDNKAIKGALEREREKSRAEEKARKALEARWEGLDAEEVRKLLERLGGDEEAQLIKAGKIDVVVERRTEKQRQAHDKALKAEAATALKEKARADRFAQRVLDNDIRQAATKAGLHANAIDDALFRARTIFSLNEEGAAVQVKDGEVVLGKDTKTPYSPTEWLESMRETAPHWFPAGNAGGGGQGGKVPAGTKQMKRAAFEVLDAVTKAQTIKDKVQIVD